MRDQLVELREVALAVELRCRAADDYVMAGLWRVLVVVLEQLLQAGAC
jgi:hypothetical protein